MRTFESAGESSRGRDKRDVVSTPRPQKAVPLAVGVQTVLHLPGSQEGTGVEILPGELNDLLGLDPTPVYKLEALQVDNL